MAQLFEFTSSGIRFKGFQDLRNTLQTAWNNALGVNLDYSPTTPDGHHIDLECRVIRSVSEMLQEVVSNFNLASAKGEFLDFLGFFKGVYRNGDTDDVYRKRIEDADHSGFATEPGMVKYLKNTIVPEITLAVNDEDYEVDGVPGHSFMLTVPSSFTHVVDDVEYEIGDPECNDYISQCVWACKPAGIKSSGNTSGKAIDKSLREHAIRFSVPEDVIVDIKVVVEKYREKSFPSYGQDDLRSAIVEWALHEYVAGKDVIPQRIFIPVFSVPGIESAVVSVKLHSESQWSVNPIRIGSEYTAVVSAENVTIEISGE